MCVALGRAPMAGTKRQGTAGRTPRGSSRPLPVAFLCHGPVPQPIPLRLALAGLASGPTSQQSGNRHNRKGDADGPAIILRRFRLPSLFRRVRNWDFVPDSRGDPVRAAETHHHPWRRSLQASSSPQHRPDAPGSLGRPLRAHIEEPAAAVPAYAVPHRAGSFLVLWPACNRCTL
jgi:hypothetical protein